MLLLCVICLRSFVGGLHNAAVANEAALRAHFAACGEIASVRVMPAKSVAFVEFATRGAAETAVQNMHHASAIGGTRIHVNWANAPSTQHRHGSSQSGNSNPRAGNAAGNNDDNETAEHVGGVDGESNAAAAADAAGAEGDGDGGDDAGDHDDDAGDADGDDARDTPATEPATSARGSAAAAPAAPAAAAGSAATPYASLGAAAVDTW